MGINNYNKYLEDIEFLSAQVVFPKISAEDFKDKNYKSNIYELIDRNVGGFCVFKGDVNETKFMINELQSRSKVPLLFCADFENGLPMRLSGGTEFPHPMALARTKDPELTFKIAKAIALECKQIGIHWNLAPVADINSNKNNPIINIRAFGEIPETVSAHVESYIKGIQSENVLACAKHFPGHGDTSVDSHIFLPVLNQFEKRIRDVELKPFVTAIKNEVRSIMVGHLSVPVFEPEMIPASISFNIINKLLREELNYEGLIVSDALDMKSITSNFSNKEASIKAVSAGCNVLLLPSDPLNTIEELINKSSDDENFKNKLRLSVNNIFKAKDWAGLFKAAPLSSENVNHSINHEKLALRAAYKAIEIIGESSLMPLPENGKFAGFAFVQDDNLEKPALFFKILAQAVDNDCDFAFIDDNISNEEMTDILNSIDKVDFLIFAFFYKAKAYHGSVDIPDKLRMIVDNLSNKSKSISVFFGNPYLLEKINSSLKLNTFSDSLASIAASILYLSGRKPA